MNFENLEKLSSKELKEDLIEYKDRLDYYNAMITDIEYILEDREEDLIWILKQEKTSIT